MLVRVWRNWNPCTVLVGMQNICGKQYGRSLKNWKHTATWSSNPTSGFSSVQSFSHVRLFATPWIAARQASLSITNSRSSLRLTSIKSVMPSSHLILCCPLPLLPPIPLSIRVFSNESTLRMRWPKYWSFSFSISPSNEHPGQISYLLNADKHILISWKYRVNNL